MFLETRQKFIRRQVLIEKNDNTVGSAIYFPGIPLLYKNYAYTTDVGMCVFFSLKCRRPYLPDNIISTAQIKSIAEIGLILYRITFGDLQ